MKSILSYLVCWFASLVLLPARAQTPPQMNYQGRVVVDGTNFHGTGHFKFALVDGGSNRNHQAAALGSVSGGQVVGYTVTGSGSGYVMPPAVTVTSMMGMGSGATAVAVLNAGTVSAVNVVTYGSNYLGMVTVQIAPPPPDLVFQTLWSHDASSTEGSEPASSVPLAVNRGLYSVQLGDPSASNMLAGIAPSVFAQPDVRLRVWFDDGVSGFRLLAPDQRIASVGYAMLAATVTNGAIASAQLATGAVQSVHIADQAVGNAQLAPNAVYAWNLSTGAVGHAALDVGAVHSANIGSAAVGNLQLQADAVQTVNLLDGAVTSAKLAAGAVTGAKLATNAVTPAHLNAAAFSNTFWMAGGNTGTLAGTHYLGTQDNTPLEMRVGGSRVALIGSTNGSANVVLGAAVNSIAAGTSDSAILGGSNNVIQRGSSRSVIVAGEGNTIDSNSVWAVIGGGTFNHIGYYGSQSVLGGGYANTIENTAHASVLGGGYFNLIATGCSYGVVAGGGNNQIRTNASNAAIGGGLGNRIGASAYCSTIPGGCYNAVGDDAMYALAAGRRAKANHDGTFVWADAQDADFASTASNQVSFRCQGGVRFASGSTGTSQTVAWTPGSASWSFTSDRATKANFAPVDVQAIVDKVAALPLTEWNYIGYPQRHVGPVAQDFHAAFPWSGDATTINSADEMGIALAAIQGLAARNAELAERVARLETLLMKSAPPWRSPDRDVLPGRTP